MFERAQREDVKIPKDNIAKPVSKAEVRRRIIDARGIEAKSEKQRKFASKEFFSTRKNFMNGDPSAQEKETPGNEEFKNNPKKFQSDSRQF